MRHIVLIHINAERHGKGRRPETRKTGDFGHLGNEERLGGRESDVPV